MPCDRGAVACSETCGAHRERRPRRRLRMRTTDGRCNAPSWQAPSGRAHPLECERMHHRPLRPGTSTLVFCLVAAVAAVPIAFGVAATAATRQNTSVDVPG